MRLHRWHVPGGETMKIVLWLMVAVALSLLVAAAGPGAELEAALAEKGSVDIIVVLKEQPKKASAEELHEEQEAVIEAVQEELAEAVTTRSKMASLPDALADDVDEGDLVDDTIASQEGEEGYHSEQIKATEETVAVGETLAEPVFEVEHQYTIINGFSATVDEAGLEALLDNPDVAHVELDHTVHASLVESVPLTNASLVWNTSMNGIMLNGTGQTVCVLDTGIDYTHPSLGGAWGVKVIGGYDVINSDADPMDDFGHGTHVAGIVASEGAIYRGVAPGAKLVAVKVLDENGDGTFSDIVAGIDWCVNNATKFNISVITMSLGTDCNGAFCYSSYCDSTYPSVATAAANAVNQGIMVIAASGNQGSTTRISSPACIESIMAVGSTDDGSGSTSVDAVSSFTNRNSLLDLMAPGQSIVSLAIGGGTATSQGTSMAAPHVAGAAALLKQYVRLQNGTNATVSSIESALENTGQDIVDSSSGLIFPRINIFKAIVRMDRVFPVSKSVAANSSSVDYGQSVHFNATLNDTLGISSYVFSWNSSGSWANSSPQSAAGKTVPVQVNQTIMSLGGSIGWRFYFNDTNNNWNETATNVLAASQVAVYPPTVISPAAGSYHRSVDIRVTSNHTGSVVFYFIINGTANQSSTNLTSFTGAEQNYSLSVIAYNGTVNSTPSPTIYFVIDTTSPQVAFSTLTPENNTNSSSAALATNITFSELNVKNVTWNTNGTIFSFNAPVSNHTQYNLKNGVNSYNVTLCDNAGNCSTTETRTVVTDLGLPTQPASLVNYTTNDTSVALAWSASADSLTGIKGYYLYRNNSLIANKSADSLNHTDLAADGNKTYMYNVSGYDYAGNRGRSQSVMVLTPPDITPPSITNIQSTTTTTSIVLSWTTSEEANSTVYYSNDATNLDLVYSNSTRSVDHAVVLDGLSAGTTYYYVISATDDVLLTTNTTSSSVSTSSVDGGGSGGGGGGGGGAAATVVEPTPVSLSAAGTTLEMVRNDKIGFRINREQHTLTLVSVRASSVEIEVASTPTVYILPLGQQMFIDVDDDGKNDLRLILTKIEGRVASIEIVSLAAKQPLEPAAEAPKKNSAPQLVNTTKLNETILRSPQPRAAWIIVLQWVGVVAALILGVGGVMMLHQRHNDHILKYIEEGFMKGHEEHHIRQRMREAGWAEHEIHLLVTKVKKRLKRE